MRSIDLALLIIVVLTASLLLVHGQVTINSVVELKGEGWSFRVLDDSKSYTVDSATIQGAKELRTLLTVPEQAKDGIVTFPVAINGLTYVYQSPLTEEFTAGEEYDFINATHVMFKGEVKVHRPENIVQSYACFKDGRKVMHIYRSAAIDANGEKIWLDMKMDSNSLVVYLDAEWMEKAVYPVTIDPSFGYTTVGGSTGGGTNVIYGSLYACSEAGTADNMTVYITNGGSTHIRLAIYDDGLNLLGETDNTVSSDGWNTIDLLSSVSVSAADYWLCLLVEDVGSCMTFDSGGASNTFMQKTYSYNAYPATITPDSYGTLQISIYVNYTATAAPTPTPTATVDADAVTTANNNFLGFSLLGVILVMVLFVYCKRRKT